jgi:hypothetical protein
MARRLISACRRAGSIDHAQVSQRYNRSVYVHELKG